MDPQPPAPSTKPTSASSSTSPASETDVADHGNHLPENATPVPVDEGREPGGPAALTRDRDPAAPVQEHDEPGAPPPASRSSSLAVNHGSDPA